MEGQFRFGFFTEEEHHSILDHPACVEFPWRCDAKSLSSSAAHGTRLEKESVWDCNSQDSNLKDENHNHVPNKANLGSSGSTEPTERTIGCETEAVKTTQPLPSRKTEEQRTDLDTTVSSERRDVPASSGNSHELSGSIQNNPGPVEITGPMINGHDDGPSLNTKDNVMKDNDTNDCNGRDLDSGVANSESENENTAEKTSDRAENPANDTSHVPKSVPKAPSTWASLFSGEPQAPKQGRPLPFVESAKTAPVTANSSVTPVSSAPKELENAKKRSTVSNGTTVNKADNFPKVVDLKEDPFSRQIAEQISRNEIVYRSPGLMPRGFINSSTWCYINATLQALLTCSPFCHLMRSFPSRHAPQDGGVIVTSTPILDSFVRLVKELKPLSKRNVQQRNNKEQWHGVSHEPEYIYKMLTLIKSNLSERGRQEDAEEFLSCILNGLHEEMLKLTDHYFGKAKPLVQNGDVVHNSQTELGYEVPVHEEDPDDASTDDQEQWEEVHATRKSRSSITRRADMSKTPMSDVFRGELRSDLSQEGQRSTATLEPFFTLPLDINDQNTWSVNEALEHLTRTEMVEDFTNSKTKAKVEVTRRQTLETLPPVLILHLKRFVYDKEGGSLKLDKDIQYHTDLVISKDLLSRPARKLPQEKRTYKLFAVVYHHGKKSTGGHYTTDVYHDGLNCWLRIDDQHIKTTNVHEVVRHNPQRTAYLLYYKRTDLMSV